MSNYSKLLAGSETHINNSSTAVQVFVKVLQNFSEFLYILLAGLQQHGLEIDWQPIPVKYKHGGHKSDNLHLHMKQFYTPHCTSRQTL